MPESSRMNDRAKRKNRYVEKHSGFFHFMIKLSTFLFIFVHRNH